MYALAIPAKNQSNWQIHGLLIVAVMLIATSFPVGKIIANALPTDIMMQIRFVMAAVCFIPFVAFKHGISIPPVKKHIHYALLSLPLATFFLCMFEALKYTSAINTGALFTTVPAMTAAFAWLINRDKTGLNKAAGLLLGTVGAIWIVFRGEFSALVTMDLNRGDQIFFYGALAFSLYNVCVKRIYTGEPTEVMTFWVIVYGAAWLSIYSIPSFDTVEWNTIPFEVYGALLYLAIFTTLITFFLFQLGTVKLGPTKVAAYGFLNPLFVLMFSIIMGLAELSVSILPGLILVVMAMLVIQRDS